MSYDWLKYNHKIYFRQLVCYFPHYEWKNTIKPCSSSRISYSKYRITNSPSAFIVGKFGIKSLLSLKTERREVKKGERPYDTMHMNNTVLSQTPHQNIVATDLQIIYHACAGFYSESSEIAYNFTEYSKQKTS